MKQWLGLVKMIVPAVLAVAAPGVGALIGPLIVQGITSAEQIPGATGAEKKQHALELVALGLAGANATGKVTIDVNAVLGAANQAIDTTVSVVNLVHQAHADAPLVGGVTATDEQLAATVGS